MRTVREEERVRLALDSALERWPRTHDAWEAITWIVVRDPQAGAAVTESGRTRAFTFAGARSIGMPTITIIYEAAGEMIIIHEADFSDAKYGEAGKA